MQRFRERSTRCISRISSAETMTKDDRTTMIITVVNKMVKNELEEQKNPKLTTKQLQRKMCIVRKQRDSEYPCTEKVFVRSLTEH